MSYDYKNTHNLILKSAMKTFSEVGFRNASIRNICKDAGVTNGAFYAHFESKEALFAALVSDKLAVFNEAYQDMSEISISSVEDVLEMFASSYSSIETLIHYVYSEKDVFMLVLKSSSGTSYENFVSDLIDAECRNTMVFLDSCRKFMKNPENISERFIRLGSSMVINAMMDAFAEGVSEEENILETKKASDFCIAGYRQLLGL
ncbi:MAG: TetR/AcrR family transcriptional regulator; helix-turn-helix transcriptional regulator [Saccharofermentans sp.]|nr:TetR/AcrR family transcriptional regulator; helix-turn-helix transcriptional regulator [Saccharofermentans sp.]